jgi:asparagine N-glycosylation enzyme membrane subunit Stt3
MRTGPVGPVAHRFRPWITWLLVAGAVLAYALWPYPTGWVVVGLALALLFALTVLDFLAEEEPDNRTREGTTP